MQQETAVFGDDITTFIGHNNGGDRFVDSAVSNIDPDVRRSGRWGA